MLSSFYINQLVSTTYKDLIFIRIGINKFDLIHYSLIKSIKNLFNQGDEYCKLVSVNENFCSTIDKLPEALKSFKKKNAIKNCLGLASTSSYKIVENKNSNLPQIGSGNLTNNLKEFPIPGSDNFKVVIKENHIEELSKIFDDKTDIFLGITIEQIVVSQFFTKDILQISISNEQVEFIGKVNNEIIYKKTYIDENSVESIISNYINSLETKNITLHTCGEKINETTLSNNFSVNNLDGNTYLNLFGNFIIKHNLVFFRFLHESTEKLNNKKRIISSAINTSKFYLIIVFVIVLIIRMNEYAFTNDAMYKHQENIELIKTNKTKLITENNKLLHDITNVASTQNNKVNNSTILKLIAENIPGKVKLIDVTISSMQKDKILALKGITTKEVNVSKFINNLRTSPAVISDSLIYVKRDKKKNFYEFKLLSRLHKK